MGTAMGTKTAPSLANIFMADLEKSMLEKSPIQPLVWWRYIDDIFSIWTSGEQTLSEFVTRLNDNHPTIKFSVEYSNTEIPFLDTKVKIGEDRKAYTSLHTKPTDTHTYLHYRSAHPRHCKQSGPYSQLLRVKRICTRVEDFETNCQKILAYYRLRGYPSLLLQETLDKVRLLDRSSLLSPTEPTTQETDKLFLITTYNPALPPLKEIVQNNWSIIQASRNASLLENKQVVLGFRRAKNLKDILTRSRLKYPPHTPQTRPGVSGVVESNPCNKTSCRYCSKLDTSGTTTSTHTGRTYSTPVGGSCKHNNLIYLLTCQICKKQYVGQTGRALMDRMREHFYYITRKDTTQPLGRHFALPNHDTQELSIQILEHIHIPPSLNKTLKLRLARETHWIHQLCTTEPFGLNVMGR